MTGKKKKGEDLQVNGPKTLITISDYATKSRKYNAIEIKLNTEIASYVYSGTPFMYVVIYVFTKR